MAELDRIPEPIRDALLARNLAREVLTTTEAELQRVLRLYAGQTYTVEGVPFKVCGKVGALYWRRMTGPEETERLREAWRNE